MPHEMAQCQRPRELSYEELIARAERDRAAMIKAMLGSAAVWMKSLRRLRSIGVDRSAAVHARPDT